MKYKDPVDFLPGEEVYFDWGAYIKPHKRSVVLKCHRAGLHNRAAAAQNLVNRLPTHCCREIPELTP